MDTDHQDRPVVDSPAAAEDTVAGTAEEGTAAADTAVGDTEGILNDTSRLESRDGRQIARASAKQGSHEKHVSLEEILSEFVSTPGCCGALELSPAILSADGDY